MVKNRGRHRGIQLLAAGLLSLFTYFVVLVGPYPLRHFFDSPLLDLGEISNHEPAALLALVIGYTCIFCLYHFGYRAARHATGGGHFRLIVLSVAGFATLLLFVYPIGANDVYDYIFRARMWAQYGLNPLATAPAQVSGDPWYEYTVWAWTGSAYGPLWTYLSAAVYGLAGDDLLRNVLLFKSLPASCIIISSWLAFDLLRRAGTKNALGRVLLCAWNPLLLFESVVNGHNDAGMMTLVVLALWFTDRRRFRAAVISCVLAASIKAAALVVLPIIWLAGLRAHSGRHERRRFLIGSVVGGVLAGVILYGPLWAGPATLDGLIVQSYLFSSSPAAVVKLAVEHALGAESAVVWVRLLFTSAFVAAYFYRLRTAPTDGPALSRQVFDGFLLFLLLGATWFQPWYVIWVVTLLPFVDGSRQRLALVWSASALSTYVIFYFLWFWYPAFLNQANQLVFNLAVLAAWLSPPVVSVLASRRTRSSTEWGKEGRQAEAGVSGRWAAQTYGAVDSLEP